MANVTVRKLGNRKAAEAVILKWVKEIDPSGRNSKMTEQMFANLSDAEFFDYMKDIREGKDYLTMIVDNLTGSEISVENNLAVGKRMGHKFFQRIWTTDSTTGIEFLTNQEYYILHLPCRRQIQTLESKMSVPDDNVHIDDLTDQPTGVSKSSAISAPESVSMYAQGFSAPILELIKVRGGDLKAMHAIDRTIHETGKATLGSIEYLGSRTKSTQTLSTFLTGMMLRNNF